MLTKAPHPATHMHNISALVHGFQHSIWLSLNVTSHSSYSYPFPQPEAWLSGSPSPLFPQLSPLELEWDRLRLHSSLLACGSNMILLPSQHDPPIGSSEQGTFLVHSVHVFG